ncbi:MAG: hypothetical protein ACTTJW_01065 [Sphaerochaeta sp.]
MNPFRRIREWFMSRFIDTGKIENAFNVKIAASSDMGDLIQEWMDTYQGNPKWCGDNDGQVSDTLSVASIVCNDLAQKAVSELSITLTKNGDDRLFDNFVNDEIVSAIREQTEYGLAGGAFIVRPYYDARLKRVSLSWYTADRFIPVEWAGRRCVSGIFVDQIVKSKNNLNEYYTKLELHKWEYKEDGVRGAETISVKCFKSESSNDIGKEIQITDVQEWKDITTQAFLDIGQDFPLFVYAKTPFANNKSPNNKTGVSLFKDGLPHLEEIDRCWNSLRWERDFTEGKVFVDADMMEQKRDEDGRLRTKLSGRDKKMFHVMQAEGKVTNKFMDVFSPEIRQAEYVAMIKAHLSLFCMAIHVDPGAYIFDENTGAVTATEIRTKNQKTFGTLTDLQKNTLTPAIMEIFKCVRTMQKAYGCPAFDDDMDIAVGYGDSILVDSESEKENAKDEVQIGLRSKKSYLMEFRNMSEEDAEKELEQIKAETPVETDFFGLSGKEDEENE